MHYLLPIKIETMTSLEIATLTGSRHQNVMRSIQRLITTQTVSDTPLEYDKGNQGHTVEYYRLSKRDSHVVVAQISPKFTGALVDRWMFLEEQLRIIQLREGTKKHQLEAMEALKGLLPPGLECIPLSYIKANTVVNKATSNLFGFPKMMSKADMSTDMLEARDKILDDYIKLYEVLEDNHEVKAALYRKYQPCRLELKC